MTDEARLTPTVGQEAADPAGRASLARSERLHAELDRIRRVLRAEPTVRQLVLFGSVAAGRTHRWSDLDLVVIEETEASFIGRSLRLARLVNPRVGVQFLVYTPGEIRALRRRPFVELEILQKGRVVPMHPKTDAFDWLAFAGEDLRMAELALGAEIFNQTCFHAQQAAEKCLKACLAATGVPTPRTHIIVDLLDELPESARAAVAELEMELKALDQFYIPTRYPDALPGTLAEGLPQRSHAEAALATARRCADRVRPWVESLPARE